MRNQARGWHSSEIALNRNSSRGSLSSPCKEGWERAQQFTKGHIMSDTKSQKPRSLGPLVKPDLPKSKADAQRAPRKRIDDDFLKVAIERADEAYRHEADNMSEAYEDLAFKAGDQ